MKFVPKLCIKLHYITSQRTWKYKAGTKSLYSTEIFQRGFTLVEMVVTLTILIVISGFFISFIQFSPFFGNMDNRRNIGTIKKISSDLESFFIQYPINSGSITLDTIASRYFDRISLAYSGGVIILGAVDKNTHILLDPNSNDTGFLGWSQGNSMLDTSSFTGVMENMSEHIEILSLKGTLQNNLLRIGISFKPMGGEDTYETRNFLYIKNLNP